MMKPVDDGKKIIVRLFNTSADEKSAKFIWGSLRPKEVYLSNLFEEKVEKSDELLKIPGYGIRTLMVAIN